LGGKSMMHQFGRKKSRRENSLSTDSEILLGLQYFGPKGGQWGWSLESQGWRHWGWGRRGRQGSDCRGPERSWQRDVLFISKAMPPMKEF
jgi:hypothetical protein